MIEVAVKSLYLHPATHALPLQPCPPFSPRATPTCVHQSGECHTLEHFPAETARVEDIIGAASTTIPRVRTRPHPHLSVTLHMHTHTHTYLQSKRQLLKGRMIQVSTNSRVNSNLMVHQGYHQAQHWKLR